MEEILREYDNTNDNRDDIPAMQSRFDKTKDANKGRTIQFSPGLEEGKFNLAKRDDAII